MREIIRKSKEMISGNPVYIIGGGKSLDGVDLSPLKDDITITINESCKIVPNPKFIFWTDGNWGAANSELMYKSNAIKFRILNHSFANNFITKEIKTEGGSYILSCTGANGFDPNPSCVRGNNTGCNAINFAANMGAKSIYLFGFDMRVDPATKKSNFHDNYQLCATDEIYKNLFLKPTQDVVDECMRQGIDVINVNIFSRLKTSYGVNVNEWNSVLKS